MRVSRLRVCMLGIALVEFVLNPFFVGLATAAPVTLPSGMVLDLSQQQVDAI